MNHGLWLDVPHPTSSEHNIVHLQDESQPGHGHGSNAGDLSVVDVGGASKGRGGGRSGGSGRGGWLDGRGRSKSGGFGALGRDWRDAAGAAGLGSGDLAGPAFADGVGQSGGDTPGRGSGRVGGSVTGVAGPDTTTTTTAGDLGQSRRERGCRLSRNTRGSSDRGLAICHGEGEAPLARLVVAPRGCDGQDGRGEESGGDERLHAGLF